MEIQKRRYIYRKDYITRRGVHIPAQLSVVSYKPYVTKSGMWRWVKNEVITSINGSHNFGLVKQKFGKLPKGSIHNTPLTTDEIIAIDAVQEGYYQQVLEMGLDVYSPT